MKLLNSVHFLEHLVEIFWCFLVLALLGRITFLLDLAFVFCTIQRLSYHVWCVLHFLIQLPFLLLEVIWRKKHEVTGQFVWVYIFFSLLYFCLGSLHIVCTRCFFLHSYTYAPNQSCHSVQREWQNCFLYRLNVVFSDFLVLISLHWILYFPFCIAGVGCQSELLTADL